MATVFKPRRTGTASKVPTTSDLADGEIAVNYADKKVYLRSGSSIVEVANAASAGSAAWGNITGTLSSQTDLSNALAGKATSAQGDKADAAIQPDTNASLATLTLTDPTADSRINLNQHSDGSYLSLNVSGDDDSHSGNIGFYEYGGSARGYFLQISKSDLSATFKGNVVSSPGQSGNLNTLSGAQFLSHNESASGAPDAGHAYDAVGLQASGHGQTSQLVWLSPGDIRSRTDDGSGYSDWVNLMTSLGGDFSDDIGAPRIRLSSTTDASLSSTGHAFQIGDSSGSNLIMDGNELMARNNGSTSPLYFQNDGGSTGFGGDVNVDGGLRIGSGETLTKISIGTSTPSSLDDGELYLEY